MKIIFHENQLCYRGTSNALFDYAKYNEEILGNESIIMFPKNSPNNVQEAIDKFSNKFKVYSYTDNNERNKILEASQADLFYAIKSGEREYDAPVDIIKTAIHAVFKYNEPYGNVYAYVSEWLSKTMSNGQIPFVPHIVNLPDIKGDLREELGIPKDAIVFARYGGKETFDIDFVHKAVKKVARKNKNIYSLYCKLKIYQSIINSFFNSFYVQKSLKSQSILITILFSYDTIFDVSSS